jgi:hypothetical protein
MVNNDRIIEPLPGSFATEEEAGAFWDSYSTMDYAECLEPVDDVIEIRKRVFEVSVEQGFCKVVRDNLQAT